MPGIIKTVLLAAIIAAAAGFGALQWYEGRLPSLFALLHSTPGGPLIEQLLNVGEELVPGPLRGPINQPGSVLTTAGILVETNRHRAMNDLPPLQAITTLDQAAQKKVADMFARQYFAHEAPDGTGPADLVKGVGYEYIRVGENLALGNFSSDAALVQAWMDSPGHRENILHTGFSEIGLAVGRGQFEGTEVWLAVQTFATPLSSCPAVDPALQRQFEGLKTKLEQLSADLVQQRAELEADEIRLELLGEEIKELTQAGNQKIRAGNEQIEEGNRIYQETGDRREAEPYWDRGRQLQNEGEALLEQAQQKQGEYDALFSSYDAKRTAFNAGAEDQRQQSESLSSTMSRLNQQIRAFNQCIK